MSDARDTFALAHTRLEILMGKTNDAPELLKELDSAIVLGVERSWTFTNSETGQRFILSLKPIEGKK